jgi:hypothetical protein
MVRGFAGHKPKHEACPKRRTKDEKKSRSLVAAIPAALCYASGISFIGITKHWTERKFVYHRGDQSLYEKR